MISCTFTENSSLPRWKIRWISEIYSSLNSNKQPSVLDSHTGPPHAKWVLSAKQKGFIVISDVSGYLQYRPSFLMLLCCSLEWNSWSLRTANSPTAEHWSTSVCSQKLTLQALRGRLGTHFVKYDIKRVHFSSECLCACTCESVCFKKR